MNKRLSSLIHLYHIPSTTYSYLYHDPYHHHHLYLIYCNSNPPSATTTPTYPTASDCPKRA